MAIIGKVFKQPVEVQDYDIDFTEWLASVVDVAPGPATNNNLSIVAPAGITLMSYTLIAGVVKLWVSGGTDGVSYKIVVTLTSVGGRIKQVELQIKIKDT